MKEEIEKMYIQALIDDLAPNVFADQVLRLVAVVGQSEQLLCDCSKHATYFDEEQKPKCKNCNKKSWLAR